MFSIFLPEHLGRRLRELQQNGALSMVGLLVAWRLKAPEFFQRKREVFQPEPEVAA